VLEVGKSLVPGFSATNSLLSFRLLKITALAMLWNLSERFGTAVSVIADGENCAMGPSI